MDERGDVPVRTKDMVIELLEPGSVRLAANAEACGQAPWDRLALEDRHRIPPLHEAQGQGEAKGPAAKNGIADGHGRYSAGSVTAFARRIATPLGAAIFVCASLMAVTLVVAATPVGARWNGDLQLFHHYAGTFLDGYVSRTPFLSWYPPATLLPLTIPRLLAPDLPTYAFWFAVEMSLAAGGIVLLTAAAARRLGSMRATVPAVIVLVLLTAVYLPWRYDVLPALLTAAAVASALLGPAWAAGALMGLGTALKLYPAVLIPALLAWYWFRNDRRGSLQAAASFLATAGAGVAAYLLFPPARAADLLAFQGSRGLQIESVLGSIVGLLATLHVVSKPSILFQDGGYNLTGSAANVALGVATPIELLVLASVTLAIGWHFWRLRESGRGVRGSALPKAMLTLLLALLLTNRVFSPQYVIWLIPLVVLVDARVAWLAGIAVVLTGAIFPFLYDGLLHGWLGPNLLLIMRNAVVLLLFVMMVGDLTRAPAHEEPARATEPG